MLPYLRQSIPPPPVPSSSRAMSQHLPHHAAPLPLPLPVPSVSITPATPQSTLSNAHHPFPLQGGGVDEHGFSSIALTSSFDDYDDIDEKAAEEQKSISTPRRLTAYIVPPSRRFRHPEQRQSVPPLLPLPEKEMQPGRKRRCFFCRILVVLVLLSVAVGLGVGLSAKDANKSPAHGGRGGTPPSSLLAAEDQGLGIATRTAATSVFTSALLTMPVEEAEESTSWTASSEPASTPAPTARWGGVGAGSGPAVGVLARTGSQKAARLAQRKKTARRFGHK